MRLPIEPSALNGVTVDRANLTVYALGLRALAYRPVRARLEVTGSATIIEVAVGIWIHVSKVGLLGDDNVVRNHNMQRKRNKFDG